MSLLHNKNDVPSRPSEPVINASATSAVLALWDVRLVPAAALGWLTAWAAPLLSAQVLLGAAVIALLIALATVCFSGMARSGGPGRFRSKGAAVALALAGVALVGGTAAAHLQARDDSPLRQLAAQGQEVRLRLQVTGPIRVLAPGAAGTRVLVPAEAMAITCPGPCGDSTIGSWTLSGEILVFAPAQGWSSLAPGATASATVSLASAAPEDLLVGVAFARGPPEATAPPDGVLDSAAEGIRSGLRGAAARTLGADEGGLLRGVVLGDTAGMDAILVEDFRISGLSHLTAVSGTNCAIVVGAVLWPLRRSRLRPVARAVIAGLALAGFVVLVGPQPSVLRAAAMGAITLLALAAGRARQAVPALASAVLVLLSVDPALARDLGFALSVAATAGIVLVAGPWAEQLRVRGWPEALAVATSVSAAAGLFTAPLLVLIVARVSLISLPANLLVVPVVAVVTVLGLTAALVSTIWPWGGEVVLRLTDWPLRWMVWIAERAAHTPGAVLPWPQGVVGALALAALIVVSVLLLRQRRVRWLAAAACIGIVVSGVSMRMLAPNWPPPGWTFVACDVGQGDAIVVSVGVGRAVVFDAGPDPVLVDGCLRRLGIHEVPLLVLSHLHADHVDGLLGVFRGRAVDAVATSLEPPPMEAYSRIRRIAGEAGVQLVALRSGDSRMVDGARIEVLGPVARYVGTRSEPNNSSLVARITVGEVSMLASGDIEVEAQRDLLRRETDLTADVLKVAHHGSAYQDPSFLTATGASVALISVGAGNDYGHPDEVLMNRLISAGTEVHRTDEEGDIAVLNGPGSDLAVVGRGDPIRAQASAASGPEPGEGMGPVGQLHAARPGPVRPPREQRLPLAAVRYGGLRLVEALSRGPPQQCARRRRPAPWSGHGPSRRSTARPGSRRRADRPARPRG
ncbi:ComEC/Rec2 family competence protein [soil metagenome]